LRAGALLNGIRKLLWEKESPVFEKTAEKQKK